jgi:hypothetical protein
MRIPHPPAFGAHTPALGSTAVVASSPKCERSVDIRSRRTRPHGEEFQVPPRGSRPDGRVTPRRHETTVRAVVAGVHARDARRAPGRAGASARRTAGTTSTFLLTRGTRHTADITG